MRGFNDSANKARNSNTVGPHLNGNFFAFARGHNGLHWIRIFGAKIKDMADFNATSGHQVITQCCPFGLVMHFICGCILGCELVDGLL